MARTLMLHAAMRTPGDFITAELWPMAIDHVVWMYNNVPNQKFGLSAQDLWSGSKTDYQQLFSRLHVWGCPVYVLEPKLQKPTVKIPKWVPCSRRGIFMGFSRYHSTLVANVLNLRTASITHQFHVVVENKFSTVNSNPLGVPSSWEQLIQTDNTRIQVQLDDLESRKLSEEYNLPVANCFHAGDGNLHPLIMFDGNDKEQLRKTEEFGSEILKTCVRLG